MAELAGTGEGQFAEQSRPPADAATTWQLPAVVTTESLEALADPADAPVSPAPIGTADAMPVDDTADHATRPVDTADVRTRLVETGQTR